MQSNQVSAEWQVTCQCGWRVAGPQGRHRDAVQDHGRKPHNVELTEEQVMSQGGKTRQGR